MKNLKLNWIPLKTIKDIPTCRVFVTNNITADDAQGYMSHIWITHFIHKENGKFSAFKEDIGTGMIQNITHFAYLPKVKNEKPLRLNKRTNTNFKK